MLRIPFFLYFWLIAAPLFIVATILTALTVIVGCMCGGEKFFSFYPGMLWSKIACYLTLCHVKVRGRENLEKNKSYVFVSNHQGAFDIFLIYGFLGLPVKWMMKTGIGWIPLVGAACRAAKRYPSYTGFHHPLDRYRMDTGIGWIPLVGAACRAAGFIFVDSSTSVSAKRSIDEAKRRLKDGDSLIAFPEGSRTKTGRIGRFRKGAFQIAINQHLSIVPVTLNGPFKVMPAGTLNIYPHRMEMVIHPPFFVDELTCSGMKDLQHLADEIKAVIASALWEEFL